jgi:hypothetical protein
MRLFNLDNKLFLPICLMFITLLPLGCGESDLFDEQGGRYVFDLIITDGDESNTQDIDLTRDDDCDDDGTPDDPELYTQVYGDITVSVAPDAPGLTLLRYTVNYYPALSLDDNGVWQNPPPIPSQSPLITSEFVDSGQTATQRIIIMTFDTKGFVVANFPASLFSALYTIEVEVVYENYEGNEETYRFYKDVTMSFFDRC